MPNRFSSFNLESVLFRIRTLFGHYCCPDCYQYECTFKCGRRHQDQLHAISEAFGDGSRSWQRLKAHALLDELIAEIGEDEPEVIRIITFMSFMEGDD